MNKEKRQIPNIYHLFRFFQLSFSWVAEGEAKKVARIRHPCHAIEQKENKRSKKNRRDLKRSRRQTWLKLLNIQPISMSEISPR